MCVVDHATSDALHEKCYERMAGSWVLLMTKGNFYECQLISEKNL